MDWDMCKLWEHFLMSLCVILSCRSKAWFWGLELILVAGGEMLFFKHKFTVNESVWSPQLYTQNVDKHLAGWRMCCEKFSFHWQSPKSSRGSRNKRVSQSEQRQGPVIGNLFSRKVLEKQSCHQKRHLVLLLYEFSLTNEGHSGPSVQTKCSLSTLSFPLPPPPFFYQLNAWGNSFGCMDEFT